MEQESGSFSASVVDYIPFLAMSNPVSSLLKSYRGQKPKVLKNRTSRVP